MQIGSDKLAGWLIQGKQVQFKLNYTTIQPGKRNILRLHKFYCFPNALYVNSVTAASYNNNKLISTKYWLVYSTTSIITLCLGYFVTLCRSASICRLFIYKRDNLTFFVDTCGLMKGNLFREIISLIEYTQRTRWILIPRRRRRRLTKRPATTDNDLTKTRQENSIRNGQQSPCVTFKAETPKGTKYFQIFTVCTWARQELNSAKDKLQKSTDE